MAPPAPRDPVISPAVTDVPPVWLIGRSWTARGPRYLARRALVVVVLLLLAGLTGAMTVGLGVGLVSSWTTPWWRVGVSLVLAALFGLGVGWTARRCLALRRAPTADLRTGGRRRRSGAGAAAGVLAAATTLAAVVVVLSAAAVFGALVTLLVFSLDRHAIGEPGVRRQAGYPV